jgi:5-formyltetrahydrofolate cyclo-ligase
MKIKASLRKTMQNTLSQLSPSDVEIQSGLIGGQLRDRIDDRDVWSVFLPLSKEPQIQSFIEYLLELGKTVVVPQIFGEELVPVIYTSESVLGI